MALTEEQLRAVRFYEGDVTGSDPFWGDPKAYVVLNSLFFPGIDTEAHRAAEGKRLNPAIVADPTRVLGLCRDLLAACRAADLSQPRHSFRVERLADYQQIRRAGATISFTSTSTGGFLDAYADRVGIALMEFRIPAGVPCLPYAELLREDYAKSDEQEIMLPPGLVLAITESAPLPQEMRIRDAEGNPPMVRCLVDVLGSIAEPDGRTDDERNPKEAPAVQTRQDAGDGMLFEPEGPAAAERVYKALTDGRTPDQADVETYCAWKAAFRAAALRSS